MTCPSCQTANPDGAKFCMSCGAALSNACPECSTELPEGARFCYQCGHQMGEAESAPVQALLQQYIPKELLTKLEAARAGGGMQGERRIVTMLFCDVAGSTAAAGKLDPEEWAEVMNGAFEHRRQGRHRRRPAPRAGGWVPGRAFQLRLPRQRCGHHTGSRPGDGWLAVPRPRRPGHLGAPVSLWPLEADAEV